MITTADLSSYGSIIEDVAKFLDSLPVDGFFNRPDQEIVASNEIAVSKGLVQGTKCYQSYSDKRCPWCEASKALRSGKTIDTIVHIGTDENGNMAVLETGGIVADAHWYPIAPDLYIHFVGICQQMPEVRENVYEEIKTFLDKRSPDGSDEADASIKVIEEAVKEWNQMMGIST